MAWRTEADFQIAINSNTVANTDPTAIICIVVNSTAFDSATTTTLAQLMGNVDTLAQILQVSVSGLSSVAADASQFYKPWDIMNF
ncbi:MAG: hypothetical protein NTZ30_18375, partial [Planctomycetota bacterium]|nr:hypothetical protein [Planctomycetota bacterium]